MEFMELMKNSKTSKFDGMKKVAIAILADSASQHLAIAIKGMGVLRNINFDIFDAGYDQIDLLVLDPDSVLYKNNYEWVFLFLCTQKLYDSYTKYDNKESFSKDVLKKIEGYYSHINANIQANIIQTLFIENDDKVFGNLGYKIPSSFIYQVKSINLGLMEMASSYGNVFMYDPNELLFRMTYDRVVDVSQYCNSKLAFSLTALPEIAYGVVGIVQAKLGLVKKAIILDLDNTLWGGVIGDDGLDGIEIGNLGIGYAYSDFQLWLKQLQQRGILLCICSKNNEDIAKEPFEKHPDMILRLEDIAVFVANWEDKASNIKKIQQILNIGMDSFVFIDDNPYERDIVRQLLPEVTVPNMPSDPALYKEYLISLNLFETVSYSAEDIERTKQYREESARKTSMEQFIDINEFLKSIEMKGNCERFDEFHIPRIAQLTQRSNQFNLRTIRYSEADIKNICDSNKYISLYYTLSDKFGDYGLVSVVIMQKENDEVLFVDTWLMSCRVLKRGMEEFVVNSFVLKAKQAGFRKIIGEYIPTKKNAMVKDIYEDFGFTHIAENKYELIIDNYAPKKHYIEKTNVLK